MATFHPHFRLANHMNTNEVDWPVSTVAELLAKGAEEFGETFTEEVKSATILVNGRAITYLEGKKTTLSADDEVWTILPSAGG